jgi:hypothetical protein
VYSSTYRLVPFRPITRARPMAPTETPAASVTVVASPQKFLLKSFQTLLMAVVLVVFARVLQMGTAPFVTFAFVGVLVMQVAAKPSLKELAAAVGFGAIVALLYFAGHGQVNTYAGRWIGLPGGFIGMGSLEVLATRWIWAEDSDRGNFDLVHDAALLAGMCICSAIALGVAMDFTPLTYDRMLLAADMKFGGPPSWVIGELFRSHNWFSWICAYVYNSLPIGLSVCLAAEWRMRHKGIRPAADLRWLVVTLGIIGFLMYQICPASGPVYLADKPFPFEIPNLSGMALIAVPVREAARNAMPSLHVGWTLLLFWSLRGKRRIVRAIALLYLVLTVFATLGSGQHYLVDLMVAPAVALTVQAVCTPGRTFAKLLALGLGASLSMCWLIAFRSGAALAIPQGAWMWTLASMTAAIPLVLFSRMHCDMRCSEKFQEDPASVCG